MSTYVVYKEMAHCFRYGSEEMFAVGEDFSVVIPVQAKISLVDQSSWLKCPALSPSEFRGSDYPKLVVNEIEELLARDEVALGARRQNLRNGTAFHMTNSPVHERGIRE